MDGGSEPRADLGPLISVAARQRAEQLIQRSVDAGAACTLDGMTPTSLSLGPHVIDHVTTYALVSTGNAVGICTLMDSDASFTSWTVFILSPCSSLSVPPPGLIWVDGWGWISMWILPVPRPC